MKNTNTTEKQETMEDRFNKEFFLFPHASNCNEECMTDPAISKNKREEWHKNNPCNCQPKKEQQQLMQFIHDELQSAVQKARTSQPTCIFDCPKCNKGGKIPLK